MFAGTIWVLFARRSIPQVNRVMLTVACLLLLCSTAVRGSFHLSWISIRTKVDFPGWTAHHNRHNKNHGGVDIIPRYIPRRTYCIFIGRVPMDVRVQELCVRCTIAHRGWRHRKQISFCQIKCRSLSVFIALPLLHGMEIEANHDFTWPGLVCVCW